MQNTLQTDSRDSFNAVANSELCFGDLAVSRLCQQRAGDPRQPILKPVDYCKICSGLCQCMDKFDDSCMILCWRLNSAIYHR